MVQRIAGKGACGGLVGVLLGKIGLISSPSPLPASSAICNLLRVHYMRNTARNRNRPQETVKDVPICEIPQGTVTDVSVCEILKHYRLYSICACNLLPPANVHHCPLQRATTYHTCLPARRTAHRGAGGVLNFWRWRFTLDVLRGTRAERVAPRGVSNVTGCGGGLILPPPPRKFESLLLQRKHTHRKFQPQPFKKFFS
jgi:hypothetical protein